MNDASGIKIIAFQASYQDRAKSLVLAGLAQRWGELDDSLNPDLDDIACAYADGHFLLALENDEVVGTGALVPESSGVVRVVRMSTSASKRNRGIGSQILNELIGIARGQGCRQIVLETTTTWKDAVDFYLNRGFRRIAERDGESHFVLDLH